MCWFALVRNIYGCLTTLHAPISDSDNIVNRPKARLYDCHLTANLDNRERPVVTRLTILLIWDLFLYLDFDACIPLRTGITVNAFHVSFKNALFVRVL